MKTTPTKIIALGLFIMTIWLGFQWVCGDCSFADQTEKNPFSNRVNPSTNDLIELKAGAAKLSVNDRGWITRLVHNGKNFIEGGSPLLQIQLEGSEKLLVPIKAKVTKKTAAKILLELKYSGGSVMYVTCDQKRSYLSLELTKVQSENLVRKVVWGPIKTEMKGPTGEIAGILREGNFAFVLQTLNIKTIGGSEDRRPNRDNRTAKSTEGGSFCEAFSLDRTKPSVVDTWSCLAVEALPVLGETVVGSRIALFGVEEDGLLDAIEAVELEENLPHPKLKREWNKRSWFSQSTRLLVHFNESNIDQCIELAKACGVQNIYHPHLFRTWGNFELPKKGFPNGMAGLKACVDKAKQAGITVGVHTLTNFISTNDPYVTPKPHPNLAVSGKTKLARKLGVSDKDIYLADEAPIEMYRKQATPGNYEGPGSHKVLRIGDELIYFNRVSKTKPWVLYDCKRGWNGTVAKEHHAGDQVAKLISHPYKVFFPDIVLQKEMAANLAKVLNESGIERISFDGFEGCYASGHGKYGCNLFAKTFFENLKNKEILLNSSITTNYTWHIMANESWGEPWTGGFRASHFEYRLKSIAILKNNLLPFKLGQFNMAQASLDDIHWLMGFSAGHHAGVDLYISPKALADPKEREKIQAIKNWTEFRLSGQMTPAIRLQLQNPLYEFKLERSAGGNFRIASFKQWKHLDQSQASISKKLVLKNERFHVSRRREPGQPTNASWQIESPEKQVFRCQLQFVESNNGQAISNPTFQLGTKTMIWKGELRSDEILHISGHKIECLRKGKKVSTQTMEPLMFDKGSNVLNFDYTRADVNVPGPKIKIEILSRGIK